MKKESIKWLDYLWSLVIKSRAGFKDEISGEEDVILNAHHIVGKPNIRLRYLELNNGISISIGRHKFQAHGSQDAQESFREEVMKLRGKNIYTKLHKLKNTCEKMTSGEIEQYLLKHIKQNRTKIKIYVKRKKSLTAFDKKLLELI